MRMHRTSLRYGTTFALVVACLVLLAQALPAQSLISGDLAGTVTDPSSAVVAGATVTLKGMDTGTTQSAVTDITGEFRFSLLKPGRYLITVAQKGFQNAERQVQVLVGQIVTANLALEVGLATQTVQVSESASLINPEASMNTSFTPQQLQQLPSAGGDITNIAFTAPGVVVNSTGGYGNFTINGLPATSNLFTVNGENDMDPFFNINNSGASNLTLGQNEVQEASVIANPYAGQYGQLSGAQVAYVTRSGTNEFHGNVNYLWNGRVLNANDFFNNAAGDPRPFSNANQWAAGVGGPIRKNSTFFFANTEGLRFVLPVVNTVTIPTPAFAAAVDANVQRLQPNEYSTYQSMMNLWLNAPGAASAQTLTNTSQCKALNLPGFDPTKQFCAERFKNSPTALASEWILSGRVDQKIGEKDNAFFRYKADHGDQPSHVDPISPAFNAISSQPSWDAQLNETHIFGPHATNQFLATLSYYFTLFEQNHDLAYKTFPYDVISSSPVPYTILNDMRNFPQGRNMTQYQFVDDFTYSIGRHTLKFGENFRRYDVSDHNFYFNYPSVYFGYVGAGLQNFSNGVAYQYRKALNLSDEVPIAMWGIGLYAQDEWRATSNLKLTLALRAERNSNPVCQRNCFANFNGYWSGLPSVNSSTPGSVPYSSDIAYGLHQAFTGVDALDLSPRVGFSWSPTKDGKTVISGGLGFFYDSPPEGLVDNLTANPPVSVAIRVRPSTGVLGFDPAGGAATWQASANAFSISKTYSQISTALSQLGAVFAVPAVTSIPGTMHSPRWEEWNIQFQRQLSNSWAVTANIVGNHGIRLPYTNNWANAYDPYGLFPSVPTIRSAPRVANYGQVSQVLSGAISNYNGLSLTATKRFSSWLSAHFNYTWAHNLDEVSNGGIFTYGDSVLGQINPTSLRAANYGNSDYDIRGNFTADWVLNPTVHFENKVVQQLLSGWQWSGKWFWRSGLPFSVVDGNWNGAISNGGATLFAYPTGSKVQPTGCGIAAVNTPCLNAGAFIDSAADSFNGYPTYSPQTRNQLRGPRFFDIDMNLFRNFKLREKVTVGLGIQAFNVFNHPNFANPDNSLGDSTFGQISAMAGSPTSPYGTFLGFDSAPRLFQLSGKIVF